MMMEGKTEGRRDEGERESAQGLRRCGRLGRVSSVQEGKECCSLDHECPECVEERLQTEPRRLSRHLAAMILEHRQAHKSEHGRC